MSDDATSLAAERREPRPGAFVPLGEALTWIAFQYALGEHDLRAAVEGAKGPFADREAGLHELEQAWRSLRDTVDVHTLRMRGFYVPRYTPSEARRSNAVILTGETLATYPQFDVDHCGLQRQPSGDPLVIWHGHERGYSRGFKARSDEAFAEGYLGIEVERRGLMKAYPNKATAPSNRQLDHSEILEMAQQLKAAQPTLSIGSAAASIVQDLPPNPRTGRPRDTRYIERLIAPLWEGENPESPQKPESPL